MELTRRSFLTTAAASTAAAAAGASLAHADEAQKFIDSIEWNAEYDVVVIGYGAAGASAAITACDDGAKVLLAEKAPFGKEGGDSIMSGQVVMGVDEEYVDELKKYFIAMGGSYHNYDEACFEAMAKGCAENFDWLVSLGADAEVLKMNDGESGFRSPGSGFIWSENPELEGAGHNYGYVVDANRSPCPFYYLLQDNVDARDIDIWYSSPAKHLIQDPETKTIVGVQLERDGQPINVLARGGVIMTCGGFEANQTMLNDYLQRPYVGTLAASFNEGDGVKMATEVGADLWHMSNSAGFIWGYKNENMPRCIFISATRTKMGIFVGPGGTRFWDEGTSARHGRIIIGGSAIQSPTPDPTYMILDSESMAKTKIVSAWGDGNRIAVEKGIIGEAQTIEEVAAAINVPADALQKTIDRYNDCYDQGIDADYGRAWEKIVPVRTPPFYYLQMMPTMYNTQGGARRNSDAHIVDALGNPIPHLYSAGDFGAIWPDMYNGSGNLGECAVFGRIAGHNAAAAATSDAIEGDVTIVDLGLGDGKPEFEAGENEYIGMARSKGGKIIVKVTLDGDKIADIALLQINDTIGLVDDALGTITQAIIDQQSTEVDAVAGCTFTCQGIMKAVANALAAAGK